MATNTSGKVTVSTPDDAGEQMITLMLTMPESYAQTLMDALDNANSKMKEPYSAQAYELLQAISDTLSEEHSIWSDSTIRFKNSRAS